MHRIIGLPKGDYKHLKDLPAYLFWAVPAYIGLYTGSRDKLEKKETLFKAAGFGLAFMILPKSLKWVAEQFLKGKTFRGFGPGENVAFLIQLISGMIFYASIPTIINLFKRQERAENYGLLNSQNGSANTPFILQSL